MFQAVGMSHQVSKTLEAWSLQTVCDLAIFLPFVVLALVAGRAYLEELKARLSLRVVTEVWEAATDLARRALHGLLHLRAAVPLRGDHRREGDERPARARRPRLPPAAPPAPRRQT
jgi:hypothetical protein